LALKLGRTVGVLAHHMLAIIGAVPASCVGVHHCMFGLLSHMVAGGSGSWVVVQCGCGGVVACGFGLVDWLWHSIAVLGGQVGRELSDLLRFLPREASYQPFCH
jgi:hypothetical protein